MIENIDSTYARRSRQYYFPSLRGYLLHSKIRPSELESVSRIDSNFSIEIMSEYADMVQFDVHRTWSGVHETETACLLKEDNRWIVIYWGDKPNIIQGALNRLQPLLVPARLNSDDYFLLSEDLSKSAFQYMVKEALLKRVGESLKTYKPKKKGDMERYVRQEGRWIQRIKYYYRESISNNPTIPNRFFNCSIDRRGCFSLFDGFLSCVISNIINPVFEISEDKYNSLECKKEKAEKPQTIVRISYEIPLEVEDMSQIVSAIDFLENMNYSVAHAGNPYLMMHLLDSIDGSSLDLFANGKEIYLIPVQKVTPNTYLRVAESLYEYFKEGKMDDIC